ncbi:MAG: helix-turn-helix transcriptional regulator, partial [Clostridiales Family XIII bacterium]|nr:helix-turn-helix transcriptional regulator [Clostridiales Family XIII bacterium]
MSKVKTWDDLQNELVSSGALTYEEIAESKARAAIMWELIHARKELKISQRKLEELTGVRQTTITRIESGKNSPSIDTMIKVLAPLGKTLAVVNLDIRKIACLFRLENIMMQRQVVIPFACSSIHP